MSGYVWRQCAVCGVVVKLDLERENAPPVVCQRQRCRAMTHDAGRDAAAADDPWIQALRYPDR